MKTCKSGRHQYEGRRCPVCTAACRAAYYAAKWQASHPGKVKAARVAYVGRLSAGYIADLLGVRAKDVPTELMEAKRVEIKLKRLIKEMKK